MYKRNTEMKEAVTKNMQTDESAFEGSILVLKTTIPMWKDCHFSLKWKEPKDTNNLHYQRFLYRVKKFSTIFPEWFVLDENARNRIKKSRIHFINESLQTNVQAKYVINTPDEDRSITPKCSETDFYKLSENDLEVIITNKYKEDICKIADLGYISRQLPIGVFENKKKEGNEIFTAKHSAIDIWGITRDKYLSIFELKKPGNKNTKVGIISELFFYSMVMSDLI